MRFDQANLQLTQLRVLGVLLIIIGFTMIARSSKSADDGTSERSFAMQVFGENDRCERDRVEMHRVKPRKMSKGRVHAEGIHILKPPRAPRAPKPPRPPKTPRAPSIVFVN